MKNKILEILHSIAGFPLPNKQNKPPKNLKNNVKKKKVMIASDKKNKTIPYFTAF